MAMRGARMKRASYRSKVGLFHALDEGRESLSAWQRHTRRGRHCVKKNNSEWEVPWNPLTNCSFLSL